MGPGVDPGAVQSSTVAGMRPQPDDRRGLDDCWQRAPATPRRASGVRWGAHQGDQVKPVRGVKP